MIDLHIEHDYLIGDRDEWVEDRTDGVNVEADRAMEHALDNGLDLVDWLNRIKATGLYGEEVFVVNTYNHDNFLSGDLGIVLAHTEKWGDLLIIANADAYGFGSWTAYNFTGDDDADAYGYTSGYASCDMPGCDAEWILQHGGVDIWQNGGRGTVGSPGHVRTDETFTEGEFRTYSTCPRCRMGELSFYGD